MDWDQLGSAPHGVRARSRNCHDRWVANVLQQSLEPSRRKLFVKGQWPTQLTSLK
jgi:hypothetical protein